MTPSTLAAAGAELRRLAATAAPDDPAFALLVALAGAGIGLGLALLLWRSLRPGTDRAYLRPAQRFGRNLRSAAARRLPGAGAALGGAAALELAGLRAAPAAFLAEAALALAAIYHLAVGLFPVLAHPFEPAPAFPTDDHPAVKGLWWAGRGVLVLIGVGLFLSLADRVLEPAPALREVAIFLTTVAAAPVLWRLASATGWRRLARGPNGTARHGTGLLIGLAAAAGTVLAPGLPALAVAGHGDLAFWLLFNVLVSVVVLLAAGGAASGLGRGVLRLGAATPPEVLAEALPPWRLARLSGVLAALLRGAVLLTALTGVLALWQFPLARTWTALEPLLFGFQIGSYELSLLALVAAGGVMAGTIFFGRRLRHRMYAGVLTRMTADDGLRNSIASLLYYTVIVAGMLLAVAVAGFDLTNLALIAGALSVGIGFGLQNVVNNFVSGLILLFERPIKVGDIVEYAGSWAEVRDIRVRSTVVRTFDRAELIVPNSELVSATVTNWSHSDRKSRVILPVRVAYGTDPNRVRGLILQAVTEQSAVLEDPAPVVLFQDFGESGLAFEARFFVDVNDYVTVPSDVRFRLTELFQEAGIAIPFPQRDVHIRGEGMAGSD